MFSFDRSILNLRVDRRNGNAVHESELPERLLARDPDFVFDRRRRDRAARAARRIVIRWMVRFFGLRPRCPKCGRKFCETYDHFFYCFECRGLDKYAYR